MRPFYIWPNVLVKPSHADSHEQRLTNYLVIDIAKTEKTVAEEMAKVEEVGSRLVALCVCAILRPDKCSGCCHVRTSSMQSVWTNGSGRIGRVQSVEEMRPSISLLVSKCHKCDVLILSSG